MSERDPAGLCERLPPHGHGGFGRHWDRHRGLLGQWANETAWGAVVVGNNLGNIRCSPKSFCRYASLEDFEAACIATWHNGNYSAVLSAPNAPAQLDAVVASPWSAGHYGGNLHPFTILWLGMK